MNSTNDLKELALTINQELANYVKVHDWIHSEGETFKSSIKNMLGFGIPMSKLLKEAEDLVPIWESLTKRINEFKNIEYENLSGEEKYFFDLLSSFVIALNKTISCLVAKQKILAKGVEKFGSLTWKEHQERRIAYECAIEEYSKIGIKLNSVKHIVFI